MPTLSRIRVMISSRCEAAIPDGAGKAVKLSDVRRAPKKKWEVARLLDDPLLIEGWINEEEPVVEVARLSERETSARPQASASQVANRRRSLRSTTTNKRPQTK